jgi:alcohol dehydrogenase (NADP+)
MINLHGRAMSSKVVSNGPNLLPLIKLAEKSRKFAAKFIVMMQSLNSLGIPGIGLGTFGSDQYSAKDIARAVVEGAEIGYRHFDCASVYGNQPEIGAALQSLPIPREQIWVTSKAWNDRHDDLEADCEQTLRDLRLDYLDLFLIHWPFPNHHGPGVGVDARDPHARPYIHDDYMKTWRGLERLQLRGLVRHIGSSNMTVKKLELLLRDAQVKPSANEMELHPHFQQPELFRYVVSKGIVPIGYSPLGSPSRPERDRTPQDTCDTEDPVILKIAEDRGISPAAVCIKWAVTRGQVPIPFSVKRSQMQDSFAAATGEPLNDREMQEIAGIDRGCRLIKGQVFLWEGARDWRDLWDEGNN